MTTAHSTNPNTTAPKKKRSKLKMFFYFVIVLVLGVAALFAFGPREKFVDDVRFDASLIGADLDAYLADQEASIPNLRDTAPKQIIWAYPTSKAKTPIALVYIHGFSASKGEIRPVPDNVAKALGANLYFARLKGHGRDGAAMAEPTAQDWLDDTAEALEIGARLGEKVVLIGTSTGATLAAIAATHPNLKDKIDGFVMISPNFKVQASGSEALTFPYARTWLPMAAGATRSFEPANPLHASLWTHTYPTISLLPMGALVAHAKTLPYERIAQPALFVYSNEDKVVDNSVSKQVMDRWGGDTVLHSVTDADDPYKHVIAGDALSPNKTDEATQVITDWIKDQF